MDARQVTAYPSSLLALLTHTLDPSAIPLQAPTASSEYLAYLTSDLPSHYSAYTALDTPCPCGPFVTAFASIATNECIFYRISPPVSRLDCMCTSFYPAMISAIQSDSGPLLCGSGILADLAIASATQAVQDVCNWRQGPQTVFTQTGQVPASFASEISVQRSQLSVAYTTPSYYTGPTYTTTLSSASIASGIFATTATPAPTTSGEGYGYYSNGYYTNPAVHTAEAGNSGYGYGYYDDSHQGLSAGARAGIAVGVIAFVALLIAGALLLRRRSNRKRTAAGAEAPELAPQSNAEKHAGKGNGPEMQTKGVRAVGQPRPIGMPRWG